MKLTVASVILFFLLGSQSLAWEPYIPQPLLPPIDPIELHREKRLQRLQEQQEKLQRLQEEKLRLQILQEEKKLQQLQQQQEKQKEEQPDNNCSTHKIWKDGNVMICTVCCDQPGGDCTAICH